MSKKSDEKPIGPFSVKGIIIFIVLNLIFIFGATACFLNYFDNVELQKAVDKGIIVEAEIVYIDYTANSHGSGHSYRLICRYTDENGIVYEGACGSGTSANLEQELKDEKRIGEKVNVYLGHVTSYGKGKCWAVSYGKDVKAWTSLIGACIFLSLVFILLVLLIVYLLWFYDKFPFKKKLNNNIETEKQI